MKTLLIVVLQAKTSENHLAGWLITFLLLGIIAFVIIRKFSKKRRRVEDKEGQYYIPPKAKVSTIKHSQDNISLVTDDSNHRKVSVQTLNDEVEEDSYHDEEEEIEDEEESDPFEVEATRLGLLELDMNHENADNVIVTEKGLYTVTADGIYCDDTLVKHTDEEGWDDLLVTPEGKIYLFDEDSGEWNKPGEDYFWIDYVQTIDEDENHPDGELEILDNEVLLNNKTLYSGNYDSYMAHPNFGVIVADDHRVFINKHLNYEGHVDDFYPDPLGIILQIENSFFLIRKDFPTPDLMATMGEDEYDEIVSNSDYDFVKNRILTVYSGTLLHENFSGTTWVSQKGLFFIPDDSPGKLYLRDTMVHDLGDDFPVTNVLADGDEMFIQVDNAKWYRDGKLIYDNSEYHNNCYGTVIKSDEWDAYEVWPDATFVQSKGDVIYKDGVQIFNAPFSDWFMHPKGLVITAEDDETLFFYPFIKRSQAPRGITN